MNRRKFLQMLGIGTGAVATGIIPKKGEAGSGDPPMYPQEPIPSGTIKINAIDSGSIPEQILTGVTDELNITMIGDVSLYAWVEQNTELLKEIKINIGKAIQFNGRLRDRRVEIHTEQYIETYCKLSLRIDVEYFNIKNIDDLPEIKMGLSGKIVSNRRWKKVRIESAEIIQTNHYATMYDSPVSPIQTTKINLI